MAKADKLAVSLSPFRYPTKKHKRTKDPGKIYKNYKTYRPALINEFGKICVYCRKPILESESGVLQIDHYRPKGLERFRPLIASYSNLFFSCSSCNRFKDDYWSDEPLEQIVNPCDFIMSQHLKYVDHRYVEWKSENGRVTVDRLRINNDLSVRVREKLFIQILAIVKLLLDLTNAKSLEPDVRKEIEAQKLIALKWLCEATGKSDTECRTTLKLT